MADKFVFNPITGNLDKVRDDLADLTTKSHTSLTDIGTNTHAQIDTHIADTSDPHGTTLTQTNLTAVTSLEIQSTNGLTVPLSSTYAFTRSGDIDTGLYFNTATTQFEFHRDGTFIGAISAQVSPLYSFKAYYSPALLIPDNSYAFALTSGTGSGLYFNNTLSRFEFRTSGNTKHIFGANGEYTTKPGTKSDGYLIGDVVEIQTTNATATNTNILTLEDENTYNIEALVIGVKSDGSDRASYHLEATVYRTGAGNATIQGQSVIHSAESNASWNATFFVAGSSATVQVTGVAATTIEWVVYFRYTNMSN